MNSANTLLFVMSVVVLNVASNEEIDDIIADAVQETYKEPLRKACTRDECRFKSILVSNRELGTCSYLI